MNRPLLKGASILLVEDEPLIVMEIATALEDVGAHLTTTDTLEHARIFVEHDGLSAAVLDHELADGDSSTLCERLTDRGIPFLMYCAQRPTEGPGATAPYLMKPSNSDRLLDALESLIANNSPRG
jgi:DNA-binding response OmpR family regulator